MAVRITPQGIQTFDPLKRFRKQSTGTSRNIEEEEKKESLKVIGKGTQRVIEQRIGGKTFRFTPEEHNAIVRADIGRGSNLRLSPEAQRFRALSGRSEITPQLAEERTGEFLEQVGEQEQQLGDSRFQQQFEAEGGFQQPEGRVERTVERIAEVGLQPSRLIAQGLQQLGIKEDKELMTAAEAAETPFGKAIGLTVAGLGGALLGYALAPIALSVGSVGATKLAVSLGVSKGAVAAGGLIGAGVITGYSVETLKDKFFKREELSSIQGALSEYGEIGTDLAAVYSGTSLETKSKGVAEINQIRENIRVLEHKAQQAAILDPRVRVSGEYIEFLADIENKEAALNDALEALLSDTEGLSAEEKVIIIRRLKNREDKHRQELINSGYILPTL